MAATSVTLSEEEKSQIACVYGLLAAVGFVLNTIVMFTFLKDRSLWQNCNLLLMSLTISDWLMAVLAKPVGLAAHASEAGLLGPTSCSLYAFVTTLLGFGSMLHHAAIAVQKYLIITRPYMANLSIKSLLAVISSIWAFALFWSVLPLFGWSAYVPENGTLCSLKWQASNSRDAAYIYAVFVLFYFLPIALVVTAYGLIYKTVRWMFTNAVILWGRDAEATLEIVRSRSKTTKTSLVMVSAFVIGWSPYAVASLYIVASGKQTTLSPMAASIPALFAKATSLWNPLIYFFMYDQFRASLKRSLRSIFRPNLVLPEVASHAATSGSGNRTPDAA